MKPMAETLEKTRLQIVEEQTQLRGSILSMVRWTDRDRFNEEHQLNPIQRLQLTPIFLYRHFGKLLLTFENEGMLENDNDPKIYVVGMPVDDPIINFNPRYSTVNVLPSPGEPEKYGSAELRSSTSLGITSDHARDRSGGAPPYHDKYGDGSGQVMPFIIPNIGQMSSGALPESGNPADVDVESFSPKSTVDGLVLRALQLHRQFEQAPSV